MESRFFKFIFFCLCFCIAQSTFALDIPIDKLSFAQLIEDKRELNLNSVSFAELKIRLWWKYLKDAGNVSSLHNEFQQRALTFNDKVMRFSLEKRGKMPFGGYPLYIALHGGGNTAPSVNDSQWYAMQAYYHDSVQDGIYIAPRGISNNWNLHFEQESYPLYDKLIESAILFESVNPNRVYLVGFSAGGDGVYQIITRMPERFAAANMSAGHSNHVTFDNLYNTPLCLQVGENDSAYNRNHVTVENFIKLNELHTQYQGGFVHEAFVHYNGSHNSWHDNDAMRRNQNVMADPIAWHTKHDRRQHGVNSNAIDWMNQHTRQAIPEKLVWDMTMDTTMRHYQTGALVLGNDAKANQDALAKPQRLFYWLDASLMTQFPNQGKIVIETVKSSNTLRISEMNGVDKIRILLNPNMLNLAAPVNIEVAGNLIATIAIKQQLNILARTLLERSDLNEVYTAEVVLAYDANKMSWMVS